ncbi:NADPH-dependent FMN reductase [Microbacterium sp. NPDC077663]|uniref:NADPH-dependent FMN reductase n=1 Tax=Microbacterium sp. NPDC077663 TaxID=3364189 RepID=UPI0037CC5981
MKVVAVVGNPKPRSRTADAAALLARALGATQLTVLELSELGPALFTPDDRSVSRAVRDVQEADVAIVASPTYKATYTGLLKLFLDRFPSGDGLKGVVAIPLMLGAGQAHALAPEIHLKPVLVELGAICPTPGLYQLDSNFTDPATVSRWTEAWGGVVQTIASALRERTVESR